MDRNDIETFLAILDSNSLNGASRRLYAAHSTISQRLKNLEEELGFLLFERGKGIKEVTLTDDGKRFLPIARQMKYLFDKSEELRFSARSPYLSIISVDSMIEDVLAPLYRRLTLAPYFFRFDIQCLPGDWIYTLVEQRKADVGFALYAENRSGISIRPILQDEMVLVVPESSPLASRATIHTRDLDPAREIRVARNEFSYRGWGPEYNAWHDKVFDTQTVPLISASSVTWLTGFLSGEDFWCILPRANALEKCRRFPLRILELTDAPPPRICYQLTPTTQLDVTAQGLEIFNQNLHQHLLKLEAEGKISSLLS